MIVGWGFGLAGRSGVAMPTITSISPNNNINTNGGDSITITGKNFAASGLNVFFDGSVPATSITSSNDTQIICVTPVRTAGSHNVTVVNSRGTSNASAITYVVPFPETLPWSALFLPGAYNGSGTWTGKASTGTSGSRNLVDAGSAPPPLTSNYAAFNGTTHYLQTNFTAFDVITLTAGTLVAISRFNANPALGVGISSSTYVGTLNPGGGSPFADWGLFFSTSAGGGLPAINGISTYVRDASNTQNSTTKTGPTLSTTWYMHVLRWSGTTLKGRVNTTDMSDVTMGNTMNTAGNAAVPLRVGRNSSNTSMYFNMDMRFLAIAPSLVSDADITSLYNYASTAGWLT